MKLDDLKWAIGELGRAAIGRPTIADRMFQQCSCDVCEEAEREPGEEAGTGRSGFICEAAEDYSAASAKRAGS